MSPQEQQRMALIFTAFALSYLLMAAVHIAAGSIQWK